jgi:hypothetical protein
MKILIVINKSEKGKVRSLAFVDDAGTSATSLPWPPTPTITIFFILAYDDSETC